MEDSFLSKTLYASPDVLRTHSFWNVDKSLAYETSGSVS